MRLTFREREYAMRMRKGIVTALVMGLIVMHPGGYLAAGEPSHLNILRWSNNRLAHSYLYHARRPAVHCKKNQKRG